MHTAILIGDHPAGDEATLRADLRALGFEAHDAADAEQAALALKAADGPVALVDRRFVGHRHALRLALVDPRFDASAIPGALMAQGPARARLAELPVRDRDVADWTAELAEVNRPELGELVAAVPEADAERATAVAAVAAVDEEAVRLRRAVKSRDGFFTSHCVSPYSRYLARWCDRHGLSPNQVTVASLVVALGAAACAATGNRAGYVAAGVLLLASFVLDCTDGQIARYSLRYSRIGSWLDATFDRAKEYAYYAGLAFGASHVFSTGVAGGDRGVWELALGALTLQTARHVVDFAYHEATDTAAGAGASDERAEGASARLSGRLDTVGWTVWARRMVVLPIGERWALIAVLTACTTPRITLTVLLIACGVAACYTTAGRLLRSRRARPRPTTARRALAQLCDAGPLAELLGRAWRGAPGDLLAPAAVLPAALLLLAGQFWWPGRWPSVVALVVYLLLTSVVTAAPWAGRLDWLVPPLLRAAEYLTVLVLAAKLAPQALPAAYGLLAAVAYHHYDTVYRIRGGTGAPPRWLVRTAGGHEGRVLVLVVLAMATSGGPGALRVGIPVLAAVLAVLVVGESIRFWVFGDAPAVHDETGEDQ